MCVCATLRRLLHCRVHVRCTGVRSSCVVGGGGVGCHCSSNCTQNISFPLLFHICAYFNAPHAPPDCAIVVHLPTSRSCELRAAAALHICIRMTFFIFGSNHLGGRQHHAGNWNITLFSIFHYSRLHPRPHHAVPFLGSHDYCCT